MQEQNKSNRFTPKWWELLAYALVITMALVLNAMQFPRWVVIPLVLTILLIRVVRVHFVK